MEFCTTRQKLWDRLVELAAIEVKTEAERSEEQIKAREFWDYGALDARLRDGTGLHYPGYNWNGMTDMQRRVMRLARYQAAAV